MRKAGLDSITIQIEICIEIIEIRIEIIISNCDEPRNWNAIVIQS
jgi:hypothetical protein